MIISNTLPSNLECWIKAVVSLFSSTKQGTCQIRCAWKPREFLKHWEGKQLEGGSNTVSKGAKFQQRKVITFQNPI